MRIFIFFMLVLAGCLAGTAQNTVLSVGSSAALTVKSGTVFSADSLVLTPSSDLTMSTNAITISHTAVNLAPSPSIKRVYYLNSQITYTGIVQVFYLPSELNGNTESSLMYTDSATGSIWLASAGSTVNTASHYVRQTVSAHPFIGATASQQTVLALSLISFAGSRQGAGVNLEWVISQTQDEAAFTIERSTDGTSWTAIGSIAGQTGDGFFTYSFEDTDPPSGTLQYRLKIGKVSGEVFYSYIIRMDTQDDSQIRLVAGNKAVTVYFQGALPGGVRIVTAGGETIRLDRSSRTQYTFSGLMTGVYFLQYELNGRMGARSFLIN